MNAFLILLTFIASCLFLPGTVLAVEPASPWVEEAGARVRLVAGTPGPEGALTAGIEIHLAEGWKTYWLNPGPTGLPPRLDFSASGNLAKAEPLWPAPVRVPDGDAEAAGYKGTLVVPINVTAQEPGKPVALKLRMDFGLCEKICVPAHVELALDLDAGLAPAAMSAALIEGFRSRVPQPARLGGEGELSVVAVARTPDHLGVTVRFPEKAETRDLFVRAEGAALPLPKREAPGTYSIRLKPGTPANLELIAVADGRAVAVPVALDLGAAKP